MRDVIEHHTYISDAARVDAYDRALRAVVRPGDVVLDLGAGTGILGFLAARAGAGRVVSVDRGRIVGLGRLLAERNGFRENTFVRGESTNVDIALRADVVVCDQMGPFGFDAGLLEAFQDAARRHVRPGGTFIPSRLHLRFCPVNEPNTREVIDFWLSRPAELDFSPAVTWASNQVYSSYLQPEQLLGTVCDGESLTLGTPSDGFTMSGTSTIERRGTVDALAAWWTAELAPGVHLTNDPRRPERIRRACALLPLDSAVPVRPGDEVDATIRVTANTRQVSWRVVLRAADGSTTSPEQHSTLLGELMSAEDLERCRPEAIVSLGARAQAKLDILLSARDGQTIGDIERACFEEHHVLFPTVADAQRFVRVVLEDAGS